MCCTRLIIHFCQFLRDNMKRSRAHHNGDVNHVVRLSATMPIAAVARMTGKGRGFVRYWTQKAEDATFHSGDVGGAKHNVLSEDDQRLAEAMLFGELRRDPARKAADFAVILHDRGFPVDRRSLSSKQTLLLFIAFPLQMGVTCVQ